MHNIDEAYNYIKEFLKEKNYPPTIREICKGIGVKSTSTVSYYLKKLEDCGKIVKGSYKNRALQLTENCKDTTSNCSSISSSDEYLSLPVLGTIAAGSPILAEENVSDNFLVSPNLFHGFNLFMLKVKGESMINIGILDGDYVVVSKQDTANNGEIIAAMIDGEATVKRYYKEMGYFRLHPENNFMDDIITDHLIILGKVVGVVRNKI